MLGAAIGLYVPFSKRPLACLLAFAAGLANLGAGDRNWPTKAHRPCIIRATTPAPLGYSSAPDLRRRRHLAFSASLFLEQKGAAVRYVTQFREYAWRARRPMRANGSSCWPHAI